MRSVPSFVSSLVLASSVLVLAHCDQSAGAQSPGGGSAPAAAAPAHAERPDEPLIEGETCTRSEDCPRTTRCLDGRCIPTERSLQGEVQAERGARALATNRYPDALTAYRAADQAFRARSLPVPSSVTCGVARSLVGLNDRGNLPRTEREAMARSLATCASSSPPGSAVGDQAVAALASLAERGLDPASLDRPDAALMTGQDPRPTAENTHVRLTFSGQGDGARAVVRDLVGTDALRQEVLRCFLQWWNTSHQNADQGTLRVTYTRAVDDYEELSAPHFAITPVEVAPAENGDAGANPHWLQCAQVAVQNASQNLRWPARAEHFAESIAIAVGQD